jgi:Ca2+-binding RTX toxin-like protein
VAPPTTPTKPLELTNLQTHSNETATITGTADANSQIKLYDGTSLLGAVKAGADGTWSLTTAQLSNAVHTFKAQEVDSTGHVVATSSGNAVLSSSSGHSTLTSTTGNDILVGQGHSDTFVFAPNFGHDVIKNFVASGTGHDTIQFSKTEFDSFASVLSHASQVGQDVVISSGNDTLKLLNTKLSALNSHDFHFA